MIPKDIPAWLAELINEADLVPSTVQFKIVREHAPGDEVYDQENIPGNFRKIKIVVTGSVIFTGEPE